MKHKIDIIVLSNTANENYLRLLGMTINSIKAQKEVDSNLILVETNKEYTTKEQYNLPIDQLLVPNEKFHFNKFLNYGIELTTADKICFSNNDVKYHPKSLFHLAEALETHDSVSPYSPRYCEGLDETKTTICYEMNRCFFGFCHAITRKALFKCFNGKFDEQFVFWYQDDDIIYTLEDKGFKHGLVGPAVVEHVQFDGTPKHNIRDDGRGSNSYVLFGEETYEHLWGQHPKIRGKWKKSAKRD